jgi:hypothetical protein
MVLISSEALPSLGHIYTGFSDQTASFSSLSVVLCATDSHYKPTKRRYQKPCYSLDT